MTIAEGYVVPALAELDVKEWVQGTVMFLSRRLIDHERREWLFRDGERFDDPHAPGEEEKQRAEHRRDIEERSAERLAERRQERERWLREERLLPEIRFKGNVLRGTRFTFTLIKDAL